MTIDQLVKEAVARYDREQDRYTKLCVRVAEICRNEIVEANAVRAQVTFRAKSPKSFEGKLRRLLSVEFERLTDVDAIFHRVGDLAGVRISTYENGSEAKVAAEVCKRFAGPNGGSVVKDVKDKHAQDILTFYRATHCEVFLPADDLVGTYANLTSTRCEVQICSMMAHVWNEIEHDLQYKPMSGMLSPTEGSLLHTLGHLTRCGDGIIEQLIQATELRQKEKVGKFEDVYDFVARMRSHFEGVAFGTNAGQLFMELEELGFNTPELVEEQLALNGEYRIRLAEEARRFQRWLDDEQEDTHRLELESSDILLIALLERHAADVLKNNPYGWGKGRPTRIAWLAKRYTDWRSGLRDRGASQAESAAEP